MEKLFKVSGDGNFFHDFFVPAENAEIARARANDILAGSTTATPRTGKRFYKTVETHIRDVSEVVLEISEVVLEISEVVVDIIDVRAGDIWSDKGVDYVVLSTYDGKLKFKCPSNHKIDLAPDRFFVNHPAAVKVYEKA